MKNANNLRRAIAAATILGSMATPALAASDAELLQRIELLEQQLQALKQQVADQDQQNQIQSREIKVHQEQAGALKATVDKVAGLDVKISGFVKANGMWSDYSDGDLGPNHIGRQFYIPSTIPVGGESESTDLDLQAVESRFNFSATREVNGHQLGFFTEMDFMISDQGDERITNSYNPRLRHFYLKYDKWTIGQNWSTFQDVAVLPDTVEFIGPSEGTIFVRQAQVRYTNGNLELAVENPETTVTPYGGGSRITADDGSLPDMVARYHVRRDWGHVAVAGLLRELSYDTPTESAEDTGFGASLSGKILVGDKGDDIRFMLSSGKGLGRYIGLNTSNGAVIDDTGDLEAIDVTGGFISYLHYWSPQWRSSLFYSALAVDNDTQLTGQGVTKAVWSAHANLLYSPTPQTTFGFEYMTAERELESGDDGSLDRYIFSAKYAF